MKKFLKILAAAAAVAAVIPFRGEGNESGGELEGLLWKATWKIDPDYQSEPDINITFGFNNPFESLKKSEEEHLFADDLMVDYCCDETLVQDVTATEPCTCTEEHAPVDSDDCGGDDCDCGNDCGCKE